MIVLAFGVIWWGYLELVYGYCLLKGYDIRWRDLANPIHPYQWPALPGQPPLIPKGQILPGPQASSAQQQAQGSPPGRVQGTPPGVPPTGRHGGA